MGLLKRREFIQLLLGSAAALTPWSSNAQSTMFSGRFPVVQGLTDHQSTQFSVLVPAGQLFQFRVFRDDSSEQFYNPTWSHLETRSFSNRSVVKLAFQNLPGPGRYTFEILDNTGRLADRRFFQLKDLTQGTARIAMGSCIQEKWQNPGIWETLVRNSPDYFFITGDCVYADRIWMGGDDDIVKPADSKQLWNQYARYFENIMYYRSLQLFPTLYTWDDHDYGINNGDSTYRYRREAQRVFETFTAQLPEFSNHAVRGPGVSFFFQAYGQNFFFWDSRSFKEPNNLEIDTYMYGPDQHNFVFNGLSSSRLPSWMISGTPWFGAYNEKESLEGDYPAAYKYLMSQFAQAGVPIAFVSGDTHFSELMGIESSILGYESLEITASSLHSFTRSRAGRKKNPRRVHWYNGHNVVFVETQNTGFMFGGRITSLNEYNRVNFSQEFSF